MMKKSVFFMGGHVCGKNLALFFICVFFLSSVFFVKNTMCGEVGGEIVSVDVVETKKTFGPGDRLIKEETDTNKDGVFDLFRFFVDDKLVMIQKDTTYNGNVDTWEFYKEGELYRVEVDSDMDGVADRVVLTIEESEVGDGKDAARPENKKVVSDFYSELKNEIKAVVVESLRDVAQWVLKEKGEKEVRFPPTPVLDYNKYINVYLENGVVEKVEVVEEKLVRAEYYFDKGKLERRVFDSNGDGNPDDFSFYSNGVIQREEHDLNYDSRINSWRYFVSGYVSEGKYDTNFDGIVDQWTFYKNGVVVKSEYDTNYDTKKDKVFHYMNGHLDYVEQDNNYDGKMDVVVKYDNRGYKSIAEEDTNFDDIVDRWEYYRENRLLRVLVDTDFDGEPDTEKKFVKN